ncbi:MAG: DHH family phosphoesterase [Patescibacteria group bacterium]
MDLQIDLPKIKEQLDKAREVLIVTHEKPTADSVGSTLALYLGLVSLGKKVTVACPEPITVELSSFVGVQKIVSELGNKNFLISLDYVDGSIEKVSYNIEGDKFNLVIEPRPGFDAFSSEKVHYSYAGTNADMIFAVDTIHLGGLKKLYEADKNLFATKPVVNVDRHANNAMYGGINLVDAQASSTAEVTAQLLSGLGVKLTVDIATNILNALYSATDGFGQTNVTPLAFELAATCLRAGGKRFGAAGAQPITPATSVPVTSVPIQPLIKQPVPNAGTQTPADWLKPKIFKSSTNIS